jgi:hypothetical protein
LALVKLIGGGGKGASGCTDVNGVKVGDAAVPYVGSAGFPWANAILAPASKNATSSAGNRIEVILVPMVISTTAFRFGIIYFLLGAHRPERLVAFEAARYVVTDKQPHTQIT